MGRTRGHESLLTILCTRVILCRNRIWWKQHTTLSVHLAKRSNSMNNEWINKQMNPRTGHCHNISKFCSPHSCHTSEKYCEKKNECTVQFGDVLMLHVMAHNTHIDTRIQHNLNTTLSWHEGKDRTCIASAVNMNFLQSFKEKFVARFAFASLQVAAISSVLTPVALNKKIIIKLHRHVAVQYYNTITSFTCTVTRLICIELAKALLPDRISSLSFPAATSSTCKKEQK